MHPQLPLRLGLKDSATFDSFLPGANTEALAYLQTLAAAERPQSSLYLWGSSGVGKSHLLQALCHEVGMHAAAAVYIPLQYADQFPCAALDGLESMRMVCIDDLQAIAGQTDWELALVRLFERIQVTGSGLVMTGNALAGDLGLSLPQLASRLAWGLIFPLQPLAETELLTALHQRAQRRGVSLPEETGRYLLRHYGTDRRALFAALDALDKASLAAQRKLTVPFVRGVLRKKSAD